MDAGMITARLIHVLAGVFWVGAMLFVAAFLVPAIRETGPDGGKVMAAVGKRGFMQLMPVIAILTILSGVYLYWRVSGGFDYNYLKSGPGHAYAMGGILSIIAFILGITVTRPAMMRSMELAQSAAAAPPDERDIIMAKAQALRARGSKVGNVIAVLLVLAAVGMAIGRYL